MNINLLGGGTPKYGRLFYFIQYNNERFGKQPFREILTQFIFPKTFICIHLTLYAGTP